MQQKKKDLKAAVVSYERSAQLRDDNPEVYRQMGELYLQQKALEDSMRAFTGALMRYKAAKASEPVLEAFYADVSQQLGKANQKKLAQQWIKEARAAQ